MPRPRVFVSAAVEGLVDEAVARRLIEHVEAVCHRIYGKMGKSRLRQQLPGYNRAAARSPWLVLVDLDREADCAPPLRRAWLPAPAPKMCFRVAVREVEAWLMADHEALAGFLRVRAASLPRYPEAEPDPKRTLVDLARASQRRDIREDMVPRPGSGRAVGPAYSSRLIEFAQRRWRPEVAAHRADSLGRCLARLRRMVQEMG